MIPRPCKSKHSIPANHVGYCHFCKLAVTDAGYRGWNEPGGTPSQSCPYRGEPTGERHDCKTCSGTVKIPVLSCSVHGSCTFSSEVAGIQCCKSCKQNPSLAGVVKVDSRPELSGLVSVSIPPLFTPKTAARKAIVTIVAGDKGRAMWSISEPSFRMYAARVGAEIVVSEWVGSPAWAMSAKFAIGGIAANFDEVLYADADVIFQPGSVDLFAAHRSGSVFGFNDLPYALQSWTGLPEEYQRVRDSQKLVRSPLPWYLNTGLVVFSRQHAPLIAPPTEPIPRAHCSEQHLWNARIYDSATPVQMMTADQHWQWWIKKTMRDAPPWSILHFSGMSNDSRRIAEMRAVAERLKQTL